MEDEGGREGGRREERRRCDDAFPWVKGGALLSGRGKTDGAWAFVALSERTFAGSRVDVEGSHVYEVFEFSRSLEGFDKSLEVGNSTG